MLVFEQDALLCTLDPVPVSPSGHEIRVEHFSPPLGDVEAKRHLGRLVFLEICAFIVENFEQVQAVSFAFSRSRALLVKGAQEAAERAAIMNRIGIENVQVAPQACAIPGHFVVTGVWQYSERNLAALHEVLGELRALYRDRPSGTDPKGAAGALRLLIARWTSRR